MVTSVRVWPLHFRRHAPKALFAGLATVAMARGVGAQLTLSEALQRADTAAFANRTAIAATALADAQRGLPLRGILPSVRVDGGYVRTTDPIGAFGTRLKQRAIAQQDFDPARLNFPDPMGNYSAGLVAELPLANVDSWLARRAADAATAASKAAGGWTRLSIRVEVIRAYYGSVLAVERAAMLDTAAAAAQAHVRQAQSMVRAGMATKSDALLASVRAGEIETQRIEARSAATIVRRQLALLIGLGADVTPTVPTRLPAPSVIRVASRETAEPSSAARLDVNAARLQVETARDGVQRARSLYFPRLNSFARYDWNSPQHVYGGERSWTIGVVASWSPFDGGSQRSESRIATARLALATAAADAVADEARLETQRSIATLQAALDRLAIAEQAVAQSAEAHRIVTRKYEGGLATVAELLDAAAGEIASSLALSGAQYAAISAAADRRRALGVDPGTLVSLESATLATTTP
ncbi:MAG: TolC family protein [Gemmatimonadaceae bacterium]